MDFEITNYKDIVIPLEKILQIFLALIKTGYVAFTKKNLVLTQGKELFDEYCSKIHTYLTYDNMIKLYYLYKKAESEQKKSADKRTPVPYYMVGFLGTLIGEKTSENIQPSLNILFNDRKIFLEGYKYLSAICKSYRRMYEIQHNAEGVGEYHIMIKRPIDEKSLDISINNVDDVGVWEYVKEWKKYNG